jgi:hypothetical protein
VANGSGRRANLSWVLLAKARAVTSTEAPIEITSTP